LVHPVDTKLTGCTELLDFKGSGTWIPSKDGVNPRMVNGYGQIFANDAYFAIFYPMDSKNKAGDAFHTFCREYGAPEKLRFDGNEDQTDKNTEIQQ
jgi:hypothetical protein